MEGKTPGTLVIDSEVGGVTASAQALCRKVSQQCWPLVSCLLQREELPNSKDIHNRRCHSWGQILLWMLP